MSRREQDREKLLNSKTEDLLADIPNFNVQGWVDARKIATLIKFAEDEQGLFLFRLSDTVKWIVDTLSATVVERFGAFEFTVPTEAIEFLRRHHISTVQLENYLDRRSRKANKALQVESLVRSKYGDEGLRKKPLTIDELGSDEDLIMSIYEGMVREGNVTPEAEAVVAEIRRKKASLPSRDQILVRESYEKDSESDAPYDENEVSEEQIRRISEVPDMSISALLLKKREESE